MELKNILLQKGVENSVADFFESTIHTKFKPMISNKLQKMTKEDEELIFWLNRFFAEYKKTHTIYEGKKTTYLIQTLFFDKLLTEVEKLDSDSEYKVFYSPVIVEKRNGIIVIE